MTHLRDDTGEFGPPAWPNLPWPGSIRATLVHVAAVE
jgi:hypothetical protein